MGLVIFYIYIFFLQVIKAELGEKKRENSTGNKTFYHKIAKASKTVKFKHGEIRNFLMNIGSAIWIRFVSQQSPQHGK